MTGRERSNFFYILLEISGSVVANMYAGPLQKIFFIALAGLDVVHNPLKYPPSEKQ